MLQSPEVRRPINEDVLYVAFGTPLSRLLNGTLGFLDSCTGVN